MRKKIVAGNWKLNTIVEEGKSLAQEIVAALGSVPSDVQLVLAPPFTHLVTVAKVIKGTPIALAAQNCADQPKGAFTGEVSVSMLKDAGCTYIILGHSERREYYGETSEKLVKKIRLVLDAGIKPIFCVGEKLEERNAGKHFEVVGAQIEEVLFQFNAEAMKNIVIAYEPVWAIGTGKTAKPADVEAMHALIRRFLQEKLDKCAGSRILYGGSVKAENARELFAIANVDGALVGGASLKEDQFLDIIRAAS